MSDPLYVTVTVTRGDKTLMSIPLSAANNNQFWWEAPSGYELLDDKVRLNRIVVSLGTTPNIPSPVFDDVGDDEYAE